MEILQNTDLKDIINNSLQRATTYKGYRNLVKQLVVEESTTGEDKSEAMANYTILNARRMKRWDKTIKVSEVIKNEVKNKELNQTWLVLTESWCGDAAHLMPVMNKIVELNNGINLKVVLRDENPELMNRFLTNGGQAIPKLIMIDNETGEVKNTFGPRPSEATELVNAYKAEYGQLTPASKENLQHWYNKDKGQNAIDDLIGLL